MKKLKAGAQMKKRIFRSRLQNEFPISLSFRHAKKFKSNSLRFSPRGVATPHRPLDPFFQ